MQTFPFLIMSLASVEVLLFSCVTWGISDSTYLWKVQCWRLIHLWAASWTTVTHFSVACLTPTYTDLIENTLARIVTKNHRYTKVTQILEELRWLPIKYRCMFKTATKFLNTGITCYFSPVFVPYDSNYHTRQGRSDRRFLVVPKFSPSKYKSKKHFRNSLAFDAPTIWNSLPDDVCLAPTVDDVSLAPLLQ